MSVVKDPKSPMYVPEENREIARERARQHVDLISDYLAVKDTIPTGVTCSVQIGRKKKRVLKVLNATEQDWNDWKWQFNNFINDTATLSKIIHLSDQEIGDIEKTATQYRWQISPYYASLIDPDDRDCPIFRQSVPTIQEYLSKEEQEDHYAIVYNSPAPLITRLYADRIIINVTNICGSFCRHCLRKKDIAQKNMIYPKEDVQAAIDYVAESPEIRDVLLTGGDALALPDSYIDWILTKLGNIPHIEITRLGSRMVATLPQRITPKLCEMLSHHKPVYLNTQFNHPKEITPEVEAA
ncbi:MAG: KamA family radical SAM protein, partial [Fidelibacterota bacterium]